MPIGYPFYRLRFLNEVQGIRTYEDIPSHLYHYASVNTLALILKHKTIRFNRSDRANDPEEAGTIDVPNANTMVFISCWTANAEESIPLWRGYTGNMDGVRIRLPVSMFQGRRPPFIQNDEGGLRIELEHWVEIERAGLGSVGHTYVYGPNKIHYTNDPEYLRIPCVHEKPEGSRVYFHDLGVVKTTPWAYEQEWRYRIIGAMSDIFEREGFDEQERQQRLDLQTYPVITTYIDVPLDESALSAIEITLGPKCDISHATIVEALVEKFVPSATIQQSGLRIR
jgi:hypothetical protein